MFSSKYVLKRKEFIQQQNNIALEHRFINSKGNNKQNHPQDKKYA